MIKIKFKILKFSLFGSLFLALFLLSVNTSHAQLVQKQAMVAGSAVSSGFEPLIFSFGDLQNGVNEFVMYPMSTAGSTYNIGNSTLYTEGAAVAFSFDYYDVMEDIKYVLSNDASTATSYGSYFTTTVNKKPRFLTGSEIIVYEQDPNMLLWGGDDKMQLNVRYNGTENILVMAKEYAKVEIGGDNYDWDDKVLETLDISLNIEIPLTLTNTCSINNIKIGAPEKNPNAINPNVLHKNGKPVKINNQYIEIQDENNIKVIASIKITKDGIVFDNGIDSLLISTTVEEPPQEVEVEKPKNEVQTKEIGFEGEGLTKPQENVYKGISSEKNLEQLIVGVTNFILSFVAAIAILMLIYGGYLWIVDRGDGSLVEKSKKIIAGAVIGIMIVISAYTIVNTVIKLEGNTADLPYDDTMVGVGIGALVGGAADDLLGGDGAIGGLLGGVAGGVMGNNWNNWFGG